MRGPWRLHRLHFDQSRQFGCRGPRDRPTQDDYNARRARERWDRFCEVPVPQSLSTRVVAKATANFDKQAGGDKALVRCGLKSCPSRSTGGSDVMSLHTDQFGGSRMRDRQTVLGIDGRPESLGAPRGGADVGDTPSPPSRQVIAVRASAGVCGSGVRGSRRRRADQVR